MMKSSVGHLPTMAPPCLLPLWCTSAEVLPNENDPIKKFNNGFLPYSTSVTAKQGKMTHFVHLKISFCVKFHCDYWKNFAVIFFNRTNSLNTRRVQQWACWSLLRVWFFGAHYLRERNFEILSLHIFDSKVRSMEVWKVSLLEGRPGPTKQGRWVLKASVPTQRQRHMLNVDLFPSLFDCV